MLTIPQLIAENASRWAKCEISPSRLNDVRSVASRLTSPTARATYQNIQKATGVPWWAIAVIHERECSQRWSLSIAQGDPWDQVSRHVPKGRGPFASFRDAAIDALTRCPPHASQWQDWSPGGALTLLEEYNGLGYEDYHAEASPYIWGATNQEQRGKYVGDGEYSAATWDTQLGCAAMLKAMMAIDNSIQFGAVA